MSNQENKIRIQFLLDESGSMASVYEATIEGLNAYVDTLKRDKVNAFFDLSVFGTHLEGGVKNVIGASDIEALPKISKDLYKPNGGTPLLDAVGKTIKKMDQAPYDGKTIFVIITDGEENSSREYTAIHIKDLIKSKEGQGWQFVFLGSNQNSWQTAANYGFTQANSATFSASAGGAGAAFRAASMATGQASAGQSVNLSMAMDSVGNLKED